MGVWQEKCRLLIEILKKRKIQCNVGWVRRGRGTFYIYIYIYIWILYLYRALYIYGTIYIYGLYIYNTHM